MSGGGFIEEHFDAEIGVLMAVVGAFWGLLRHNDTQSKEHLKQWLERLEKNIDEMRVELKEIGENIVPPEQIAKMDDEISELQKEINLAREKSVSAERMAKMDLEFQGLRTMIQKTREAVIQSATKEKEDLRRTEESIARLEKKIDAKVDERMCQAFKRDK
jgi:hypothetical protein